MNDSSSVGITKPTQTKWRVFYTRARAEKRCHERLIAGGIDSLLPTYTSLNTWSDRKKRVVQPLFNNYIFARVDESDRISVLQTQGIAYCVKLGSRFAEVSQQEIDQIQMTQQDQENIAQWPYSMPGPGEKVSVIRGPMKGLTGEVIEQRGVSYLILRLDSIQQAFRVIVPSDWIARDLDLAATS